MSMRIVIVILSLILLISFDTDAQRAISNKFYQKFNEKFPQVPRNEFKFNKRKYINRLKNKNIWNLIDTNAVYISKFYFSQINDSAYSFSRFFSTGEIFISDPYLTIPTDSQCNDLSYGKWNMYTIKNNGDIVIETPAYGDFVKWYYNYGNIEDDKITWYKTHLGRLITNANQRIHFVWYKKKVKLYNYKITWE